tara:strand:+ start:209 stop:325 length:117 start_codon:yes stop_codon:yes gene_type:complete
LQALQIADTAAGSEALSLVAKEERAKAGQRLVKEARAS